MATTKVTNRFLRHLKDPAQLTPYEEKLLGMKNSGLTYRQIADALDGDIKVSTITSRFKIIKEKLELSENSDG
jgi:DNA-binding CsgD family transcriptional regulator